MSKTRDEKEFVENLWQEYSRTRNIEIRNELITHYAYLITGHAKRLASRLSLQVSVDEIASAAFDGLMNAVETFDAARNVKFETFASKRVVGAVLDWLRTIDPQSRAVRQFERERTRATAAASCEIGYRAAPQEIADKMGLSQEQYERKVRRLRSGRSIPLSRIVPQHCQETERGGQVADIPHTKQPQPSHRIEEDMVRTFICKGLCETERQVLLLYYYDSLTMAETGEVLGLSESRVSQIHRQVLDKLRTRFSSPDARCAIA